MSNNQGNDSNLPPELRHIMESIERKNQLSAKVGCSVSGVSSDMHDDVRKASDFIERSRYLGPAAIGHFTREFSEIVGIHSRITNSMTEEYLKNFEERAENPSLIGHYFLRNWCSIDPDQFGNITPSGDVEITALGLMGLLSATRATLFLQLRKLGSIGCDEVSMLRERTNGDLSLVPDDAIDYLADTSRLAVEILRFLDHLGLSICDREMEKMRVAESLQSINQFLADVSEANGGKEGPSHE